MKEDIKPVTSIPSNNKSLLKDVLDILDRISTHTEPDYKLEYIFSLALPSWRLFNTQKTIVDKILLFVYDPIINITLVNNDKIVSSYEDKIDEKVYKKIKSFYDNNYGMPRIIHKDYGLI